MSIFEQDIKSENQFLFAHPPSGIRLSLKREDQLDAAVSGNKFRKLKYNIAAAKESSFNTLLTYGGAFSNHIAATATAGALTGLKTIGVIRGEELAVNLAETLQKNATLLLAHEAGMKLKFISRSLYREKGTSTFRERVLEEYAPFYELPEGGTNALAVKGCMEILSPADKEFDYICCSAGTGGTAAGIIKASKNDQHVLVFSALKGDFLKEEIATYTSKKNWTLISDYHFGGYARTPPQLIQFINAFKAEYLVQLDPVYTGKMLYGLDAMIKKGYFSKNTRILAVHTGGLQGITGINARLRQRGASMLIDYDG